MLCANDPDKENSTDDGPRYRLKRLRSKSLGGNFGLVLIFESQRIMSYVNAYCPVHE